MESRDAGFAERVGLGPEGTDAARGGPDRLPPTLILHGTADTSVPFAAMEASRERAAAAGAGDQLVGYPGREHGFFNANCDPADVADVHRRTAAFLEAAFGDDR